MAEKHINLTLKVWRQKGPKDPGKFVEYHAKMFLKTHLF